MEDRCCGPGRGGLTWNCVILLLMAGAWGPWAAGCSRELTITQADHINTAMYTRADRGEPLELAIVCVNSEDLKRDQNERLDPASGITSDEWYSRRPIPGDKADGEDRGDRFYLPADQIFLLTDRKENYGTTQGVRLRGAQVDKKKEVAVRFRFKGDLHDDDSVIYVFPKFVGPDGKVLPVRPAEFHPPGAYREQLVVEVGVDEDRFPEYYGQFIRIDETRCPRTLHGRYRGSDN